MKPTVAQAFALCISLLGCSTDDTSGPRGDGVLGASGAGIERCHGEGPQPCRCPDGTMDGTQQCGDDGLLSECQCVLPQVMANAADGALCPDLKGSGECSAARYRSESLPASVLFLVDRSGSMRCNPPPLQDSAACEADAKALDPDSPSKWDITTDALKTVFEQLQQDASSASIGLSFFSNDNACGVASEPTVGVNPLDAPQVRALQGALDAMKPGGATPIVGATVLGYSHLHQEAGASPGCIEPCGARGNRYVVLITDGEDSCPEPMRAQDADACGENCTDYLIDSEVAKAVDVNIRTFVIGAPGSEPARGFLSDLAYQGGTASAPGSCRHDRRADVGDCHFDMTTTEDFAGDLARVLQEISGAALGCRFSVPAGDGVVDPDFINVQYRAGGAAPVCFPRTEADCASGDGWQFDKLPDGGDDLGKVVLCGAACDAVRNDAEAQVDVILGCDVILQ